MGLMRLLGDVGPWPVVIQVTGRALSVTCPRARGVHESLVNKSWWGDVA